LDGKVTTRFLSRFSRITTSGNFIPEIDGLRFIAIGLVLLFHLVVNLAIKNPAAYDTRDGGVLGFVAAEGSHGVELFFIISGFILAMPFAARYRGLGPAVRLKRYFLRRLTRLEPPYILCMLLVFAVLVVLRGRDVLMLLPHLLASLLYLHNVVYGQESLVNNVAWSLEVEIQFYVLVPILTTVFAIRRTATRRMVIGGAVLACALGSQLFIEPDTRAFLTLARVLQFFLVGFLLADVYLVDWGSRPPPRSWRWDVVSLVGWPTLVMALHGAGTWNIVPAVPNSGALFAAVMFPVAAFLLYLAAFRGQVTNMILTNIWVTTIGGMCYSIYLLHNPLLDALLAVTRRIAPTGAYSLNVLIQGALTMPIVLAVCGAYFIAVEKPCMRRDWPQRLREQVRSALAGRSRPDRVGVQPSLTPREDRTARYPDQGAEPVDPAVKSGQEGGDIVPDVVLPDSAGPG